ncbi:hypothetical protein [Streptosporangium oxazolinicum]
MLIAGQRGRDEAGCGGYHGRSMGSLSSSTIQLARSLRADSVGRPLVGL